MYGDQELKKFRKYQPLIDAIETLLDDKVNALKIELLTLVREEEFRESETIPRTVPELATFFDKDKRTINGWLDKAGMAPEGKLGNALLFTRAQVRIAMRHELDNQHAKPSKTRRSGRNNTLGTSVTRHR